MDFRERKMKFEAEKKPMESAILIFNGVEGYDVYNCSIPFVMGGKTYIYGRVEKRNEWSRSRTILFENTGKDEWTRVKDVNRYQIEDPNIAVINGELVMSGVFVMKGKQIPAHFYNLFYKGTDLEDMYYFETGPKAMKDIRLVEMPEGKIGVFSRPRSAEILKKFGSESMVGFTIINSLDELCADVIDNAHYIEGMFNKEEWGGANQLYYLDSGNIGIIGHQCYKEDIGNGDPLLVYVNMAFVFNPNTLEVLESKIIGTKSCYPEAPAKVPNLVDCVFTGGIVKRDDGKWDLYSGVGDTNEGRLVIDYPFEGFGNIVEFSKLK